MRILGGQDLKYECVRQMLFTIQILADIKCSRVLVPGQGWPHLLLLWQLFGHVVKNEKGDLTGYQEESLRTGYVTGYSYFVRTSNEHLFQPSDLAYPSLTANPNIFWRGAGSMLVRLPMHTCGC
jgi:hypothetical protein